MTKLERRMFIATLLTGTFSMSISQSALSTAYPAFMNTFGINSATVSWLTTGFMLVMTLMIPVSPWLLHNVPFKRLFQIIEATFAIGTLICVWAPSFSMLMIGRLMEAMAVGIIFPSYQAVMLSITPKDDRGSAMGIAGLVMDSALAVGPIISGIILTWSSWQSLFIFFFIVSVLVLLVSIRTIKSVMPIEPTRLDWQSVMLSASFPIMLYALTLFTKTDVTHVVAWGMLFLGMLMAAFFVKRELRLPKPMLQLRVFKYKNFTKSVFMTGFSYVGLIVTTILMPLYFQEYLHVSPLISGLALVPAAVLLSFLNPLSGKMLDRYGARVVSSIGMSLIAVGFTCMAIFAGHMQLIIAMLLAMMTEAGNAFVMMPSVTAGANAIPEDWVSDGTAVTTTARQLFGSAGVMLATTVLAQSQNVTHSLGSSFQVTYGLFALIGIIGLGLALTLPNIKRKQA
ncbi:MFS transporter [Weissella viridescens]|uniref:MFS transporter n=2 Tax=Weissella viridescens TaxID=1629 RepID=A0A3P2RDZ1_WEIVI|nr:MFS transporter [Weissella viridescens]RRG18893.1 MFS transporter [Weissella viridescens]